MTYRAPKGTDDILPPESRRWRRVLKIWDEWVERYGYDLVMTPIFESTELFARGVGEGTEVVQKQMYTFEDKAGRSLTLRPEQTASVVRAYVESRQAGVLKLAYAGPQFRYERPQAGRRRQFFQLGVEYLGEGSPLADVEVIELGYRYLAACGLDDVDVLINSIGSAEDRAAYRDLLIDYLEARRDRLSPDAAARITTNPLRVLDSKEDADEVADAPTPLDHLGPESKAHFDAVRSGLEAAGIPYTLAPRLVRGLDYYTRTVFEYVPRAYEAAQDSVGGGGRYDGLAEQLGGPHTPALGFALGLDRILLALGDAVSEPALDVFVVVADPDRAGDGEDLVRRLRGAGLRVDRDPGDRSVRAQFKAADRRQARAAVVVGAEWQRGEIAVRDLASGHQQTIPVEELETWLTNR